MYKFSFPTHETSYAEIKDRMGKYDKLLPPALLHRLKSQLSISESEDKKEALVAASSCPRSYRRFLSQVPDVEAFLTTAPFYVNDNFLNCPPSQPFSELVRRAQKKLGEMAENGVIPSEAAVVRFKNLRMSDINRELGFSFDCMTSALETFLLLSSFVHVSEVTEVVRQYELTESFIFQSALDLYNRILPEDRALLGGIFLRDHGFTAFSHDKYGYGLLPIESVTAIGAVRIYLIDHGLPIFAVSGQAQPDLGIFINSLNVLSYKSARTKVHEMQHAFDFLIGIKDYEGIEYRAKLAELCKAEDSYYAKVEVNVKTNAAKAKEQTGEILEGSELLHYYGNRRIAKEFSKVPEDQIIETARRLRNIEYRRQTGLLFGLFGLTYEQILEPFIRLAPR